MRFLIFISVLAIGFTSCQNASISNEIPKEFDYGKIVNGTYSNNYLGFSIQFDTTWEVQSDEQKQMLEDIGKEYVGGDDEDFKKTMEASKVNTANLLMLFKHPLGTIETFNPSFVVVAENVKNYTGIKDGKDYLNQAKKLLQASQMQYAFNKPIYKRNMGKHEFFVLEGSIGIADNAVIQEYITTVVNGFCLSFIATYSDDTEKTDLHEFLSTLKFQ